MEAFEARHASYLTAVENGKTVWTRAGKAYDDLLQKGTAPQDALEYVQTHFPPEQAAAAPAAQVAPAATAAPAAPAKSQARQFIARAKQTSRSTGQPTNADGTVVTAMQNDTMQNTSRMSRKARWKAAAQQAEMEVLEGKTS